MTDPMRDQIRSLIATIVQDASEPIPFEDVQAMTPARRSGRGPLLAAAVFVAVVVVVGVVALLRPPADTGPVVADPTTTTITTDSGPVVESGGLMTGSVRVGEVPAGLILETWEAAFWSGSIVSFGPGADWAGPGLRPQLTVQTRPRIGQPPLDPAQVRDRLQAAHGTVTELTVRGRPGFLVENPERTNGWTVALLVLESAELASEVQAAGLDPTDVVAAAQSLSSVDADIARQDAIDEIGWDLRILAAPDDAETYRQRLLQVDGVEQVTFRTPWFGRDLYFDASSESPPTTTSAGSQTENTVLAFEFVDALVSLEDGTDVETVAVAITELGDNPRVGFSPAIAMSQTLAFLDQLLEGAELVYDDPPIYQPLPRVGPNFDTSALGVDVPLHPATADDDISERIVEAILSPPGVRLVQREEMAGPFFHLGRLDDGSRLFAAFGGTHPEYFVWHHTESGSSTGTGSLAFYGYGVTGASSGPDGTHIFIAVPLNTAVYTYELTGARYQQQPVGGQGVLPIAAHSGIVTAYDQDGNVLGTWQR